MFPLFFAILKFCSTKHLFNKYMKSITVREGRNQLMHFNQISNEALMKINRSLKVILTNRSHQLINRSLKAKLMERRVLNLKKHLLDC